MFDNDSFSVPGPANYDGWSERHPGFFLFFFAAILLELFSRCRRSNGSSRWQRRSGVLSQLEMFCLWQAGVLFLRSSKHPANSISLQSRARSHFMSKIIFYSHGSQSAVRGVFYLFIFVSVGGRRNMDDRANRPVYYGDCPEGVMQLNTAYISSDWGQAVSGLTRGVTPTPRPGSWEQIRWPLKPSLKHTHTHTRTKAMWQLVSTWGLLHTKVSFISGPELELTWQRRFPHCKGFNLPMPSNNSVGLLNRERREDCPSDPLFTPGFGGVRAKWENHPSVMSHRALLPSYKTLWGPHGTDEIDSKFMQPLLCRGSLKCSLII